MAAPALAEEAASEGTRSGFSFDLRLSGGGASAQFTEGDRAIVDFEALALGGAARWGWFIDPHVLLGAELAGAWHRAVGTLRVRDPMYFAATGAPSTATYTAIAPLGMFVEVYPWTRHGWFCGLTGAVGILDLPSFSTGGGSGVTTGYSLEAGYELSRSAKLGPAVFLRYSGWAGGEFFEDHPNRLVSRELTLGLRWTFSAPIWR